LGLQRYFFLANDETQTGFFACNSMGWQIMTPIFATMENEFSSLLLGWYRHHKRDLPWRRTKDPYKIWLSEVILQQTRVSQGLPYYERFIARYPSVDILAAQSLEEVLFMWQGLGYYSRARNMLSTAQEITADYGGRFPGSYHELRSLKGIGDYTAAAIASFAFDEVVPVVDGNVYRLLSRYTGLDTSINSTAGKKGFAALARDLISKDQPATFNQAIMEYGSMVCTYRQPRCEACIVSASCYALREKAQSRLPVKKSSKGSRSRYLNYLLPANTSFYFLKQRKSKDIWQGLYDFPVFETNEALGVSEFIKHTSLHELCHHEGVVFHRVTRDKHILSHQVIYASFWHISTCGNVLPWGPDSFSVLEEDLAKYAMPRLITRFFEASNRSCPV